MATHGRRPRLNWVWIPLLSGIGFLPQAALARVGDPPSADTHQRKTHKATPYPHKSITKAEFAVGPTSFWIFEPADPRPERAPVVVFHHGWLAVNPGVYGAWIEHLAKSGNVVIYPRYQDDASTDPDSFLPNAIEAVHDAFDVLNTSPKHIKPDRAKFAIVGHSAGGNLSVQMAALALEEGLPEPKAVVAVMPGEVKASTNQTLEKLPARMLLVIAVGDADRVVGDTHGRRLFNLATSIPNTHKTFVFYRSDYHGFPPLIASHFSPTAASAKLDNGDGPFRLIQMSGADVNALDRAGLWRLTDMTLHAAFAGKTLMETTHNGDDIRHLGYWSDGRKVASPLLGTDLTTFPRVLPTNGARLIDRPFAPNFRIFRRDNHQDLTTTKSEAKPDDRDRP